MKPLYLKLLVSAAIYAVFLLVLSQREIASGALIWGFGFLGLVPWVYGPGRKMVRSKTAVRTLTRILLSFSLPWIWALVNPFLFYYAFVALAIPAACYTILMELGFALGLRRRSWHAFVCSGVIGLLIGAVLTVLTVLTLQSLPPNGKVTMGMVLFFPVACAAFGLLISSIVFFLEPKEEEKSTVRA